MYYDQYLTEEQNPKVVEKTVGKLKDLLTQGEIISYVAVQKKPAINWLPDCVVISNKRIFLCEATKLGLTTNFEIFQWKDVKDVAFKEAFFGAKFTVIPQVGENLTIEYIPRIQARKLYQLSIEAIERYQEQLKFQRYEQKNLDQKKQERFCPEDVENNNERPLKPEEEPVLKQAVTSEAEDDLTSRLKRLKTLFDKQLITQEEYESKKNELLDQL